MALLTVTLPLLSPQQFGIWLDSSSPEQTVPYLWSEESPACEPHQPCIALLGCSATGSQSSVCAEALGGGLAEGEQTLLMPVPSYASGPTGADRKAWPSTEGTQAVTQCVASQAPSGGDEATGRAGDDRRSVD